MKAVYLTELPSPFLCGQFEMLESLSQNLQIETIVFSTGADRPTWGEMTWYKPTLHSGDLHKTGLIKLLRKESPNFLFMGGYGKPLLRVARRWAMSNHIPIFILNAEISSPRNHILSQLRELYLKHYFLKHIRGISTVGVQAMRYYQNLCACPVVNAPYAFLSSTLDQIASDRKYPQSEVVTFLFSGALTPRRNPLLFLKAFNTLVHTLKRPAKAVFSGKGPLEQTLKNTIYSLNLEAHVSFLNEYQDWWDLHRLYAQADVLVSPNVYNTWNLTVQEAMMSGMPVIATCTTTAALDLIVDRFNGFIFAPQQSNELAKKMAVYVDDIDLLRCHGKRALETSRAITPEASAQACYSLIQNVLEQ